VNTKMGRWFTATFALSALFLIPAVLSGQLTCGSTVSADVVLTEDLMCTSGPGLIVGADGITIDLAGRTISCVGSYLSCQGNTSAIGIDVGNVSAVTIKGPGTIYGFDTGIKLSGTAKASITSLTISGPQSNSTLYTHRGTATGILVENSACPGTILIDGNDVSWHRYGIRLVSAACVKIQRNMVYANNNDSAESFGILLVDTGGNTLTNNTVTNNGFHNTYLYPDAGLFDAGIALEGSGTTGNRIAQNTVESNCGDGVAARTSAAGNTISNNTVRQNPIQGQGAYTSCSWPYPAPSVIINYDLAARDSAVENRWSKTNDCNTYLGIMSGICKAGE